MNILPLKGRIFQAIPGFEDHLERELGEWQERWGSLYYASDNAGGPANPVFWHQNQWLNPFQVEFTSINEAAAALRAIQRNWAPALFTQFRRGSLIASKLPPLAVKPRPFPWLLPGTPMGAWTLLNAHTLIAASRCSSPFPNGVICFAEDREGPPSRAYLKLWEALVRLRRWPKPGDRCLDAGASPGGWTWALARLGAQVIAVDRAPLEARIAAMPGVEYIRRDAFTLKPEALGPVDWLFCDVVCYPSRLYDWIGQWLASGLCKNFVCTIKMQGSVDGAGAGNQADFETPRRFAAIPGSTAVHLWHNKHELTWYLAGFGD
jgi:23S rRNA (cytidine2498-2'-O)-methyltransferase